jgi:hypothetical protein
MKNQPTLFGFAIIFVIAFAIAFPAIRYFDNTLPQTPQGDVMYILFGMVVFLICFGVVYKVIYFWKKYSSNPFTAPLILIPFISYIIFFYVFIM